MRVGAVAKKLGMSSLFTESGEQVAVTVLRLEKCRVMAHLKTAEGEDKVQLAVGEPPGKLKKSLAGQFKKRKVKPARFCAEFKVKGELPPANGTLVAGHFVVGQKVDVQATSIGKGFAGVIKRHNFSGLGASHGVSVSHRSGGSTGQCQDPGRTFKGKKMAGRMGNAKVTIQNLEVVATDDEDNLIVIKGAVPGAKNSIVRIVDAVKSKAEGLPTPGSFAGAKAREQNPAAPEAESDESKVEGARPEPSPKDDEKTDAQKEERADKREDKNEGKGS